MSMTTTLPLTNDGCRTVTTQVNGTYFKFRTYYNRLDGWYIDIYDSEWNVIVEGIKLVPSINLMRQFTGNAFGAEMYYVVSDGSEGNGPDDLGEIGKVQCLTE